MPAPAIFLEFTFFLRLEVFAVPPEDVEGHLEGGDEFPAVRSEALAIAARSFFEE